MKTEHDFLPKSFVCSCGRTHGSGVDTVLSGKGVIDLLPSEWERRSVKRVFLLADPNTYEAAGKQVETLLKGAGFGCEVCLLPSGNAKPEEKTVGHVLMHWNDACDGIVSVGSGVLNDTGKLLSRVTGRPYAIVAAAPSMDGFASATSSMEREGLKVSLATRCADIIIGDTDFLKTAPRRMIAAGVGDMIAKYVSLCEWRISHIITGEYFCDAIADMVRQALAKCVEAPEKLLAGDDDALKNVFDGLVLSGAAMNYAGCSRPASGVEHYYSHLWDMRGLCYGTPTDLHGVQCALGTREAIRLYGMLRQITPDREKALAAVRNFDLAAWQKTLRSIAGPGAETMIALETKEGKYDPVKHRARLDAICDHWQTILSVIEEELPALSETDVLLDRLGLPKKPEEIGLGADLPLIFRATRDIRDKYILSRLCFDLGVTDEICPV